MIASQLLRTKLYIPRLRREQVPRPRLVEQLNVALARRLTLVSAPAGFGKTTLLSEWAHGSEHRIAWLSLDEGDNDPVRFLAYLIAALQTVDAEIGARILDRLQAAKPPPMEELLTLLINQIESATTSPVDGSSGRQIVLVLDDYHFIVVQAVHEALAFLLNHLPAGLHLVIATRADPPLPLPLLRGRGQICELRQADLRFNPQEAADFLKDMMQLNVSEEDVSALNSRTEGWIAGLQMVAVSMRGCDDLAEFVEDFVSTPYYIMDYLLEEVLQRQPENVQSFLLQTSILARLSSSLCDTVTGATGGQAMLDYLDHSNLFIFPLDDYHGWYRYHHLLADLLQQRLRQVQPELIPILHDRASTWFEKGNWIDDAIEHALAAGNFERVARLITQVAEFCLLHSQTATLKKWIEPLPESVLHAHPLLTVIKAFTLLLGGYPLSIVEATMQQAERADSAGAVSGQVTTLWALIAAYQGEVRKCIELSQRALELLPPGDLFFRNLVTTFLGLNSLYRGDLEMATKTFEEVVRVSQIAGNLTTQVLALCHLAELSLLRAQYAQTRMFYNQALEIARGPRGQLEPIGGLALIGLGGLSFEQNDLEAAERFYHDGIQIVARWGEIATTNGYIGLAFICQARGDESGADQAIHQAEVVAKKFEAMRYDDLHVTMHKAHLRLLQGDTETALRWVEERGLEKSLALEELASHISSAALPLMHAFELGVFARFCLAQGEIEKTLSVLRPLLEVAESAGWRLIVIRLLPIQALACQIQGDLEGALATLEKAFRLSAPQGIKRPFLEGGKNMMKLLQAAARRGIEVAFVRELLAAYTDRIKDEEIRAEEITVQTLRPQVLVEPLSPREIEVLQLIAEGLSNHEIAQKLYLSMSTVKAHTYNLYGKLDVHSRTQAVARARALGILPDILPSR